MTAGSLMKVPLVHSAILLTCIKQYSVLKTIFWSFGEWPFYTGFTVCEPGLQIRVHNYFVYFFYFSTKTYVVGSQKNHFNVPRWNSKKTTTPKQRTLLTYINEITLLIGPQCEKSMLCCMRTTKDQTSQGIHALS